MKHVLQAFLLVAVFIISLAANASRIHDAVRANEFAQVEKILNEHPNYIYTRNFLILTPLQVAVSNGNLEMVKFLVEHGADVNPVTVFNGQIDMRQHPINLAIEKRQPEIVKYLISKGSGQGVLSRDTLFYAPQNSSRKLDDVLLEGDTERVKVWIEGKYDFNNTLESGLSPLQSVVEKGQFEIVRLIIDAGVNLDFKSPYRCNGGTALHIAAKAGYEQIVSLLIQKGADLNVRDKEGFNPLYYAILSGKKSVVDALLNAGAAVDIFDAALLGDLEKVKSLIQKNRKIILSEHPSGRSPLHFAAEGNHVEVMKYLIEMGAKQDSQDFTGLRPLNFAAGAGAIEAVEFLIKNGASIGRVPVEERVIMNKFKNLKPEVPDFIIREELKSEIYSTTPLYAASLKNHIKIADILVKAGAEVNIWEHEYGSSNSVFRTPLHAAIQNNNKEMVEFLLKHGADPSAKSNRGDAAFFNAVSPTKEEIALLLMDYGLDPNLKMPEIDITLLQRAASSGMTKLVSAMLDHGGNPLIGEPLNSTITHGHKEVVELLITRKPQIFKGERMQSALKSAVSYNNSEILEFLLEKIPNIEQININEVAQKALSSGFVESAELFSAKGIKLPPIQAATALYDSARIGCLPIVEMLLKSGANVNQPIKENVLPIHGAVEGGNPVIVEMFLKKGADPNAIGENKKTLFSIAVNMGYEEICLILLNNGAKMPESPETRSYLMRTAVSKGMNKLVSQMIDDSDEKTKAANIQLAISAAVSAKETEIAESLLDKKADVTKFTGKFLLENALNQNDLELAKALIEKGAEVNEGANTSPISIAVLKNAYEIVELLLQKDADVDGIIGVPPLCEAARQGNIKIAELLIENGANINGTRGQIPLFATILAGKTEMMNFLIGKGADIKARNPNGGTALHAAVEKNDPMLVSLFIEKGLDPDAQNNDGKTPLIKALETMKHDVVPVLVANISNADLRDKKGRNALHFQTNKIETFKTLIAKGADVNAEDDDKKTPLFYSSRSVKRCKLLLDAGADINHRDKWGNTPMFFAIFDNTWDDQTDVVDFLSRNGAVISNELFEPAVKAAMRSNGTNLLKAVLKASGKKNLRNRRDSRLLFHVSSDMRGLEFAKILLDMGADPNVTNDEGVSLLAMLSDGRLRGYSNLPLTMLLLERGAIPDVTYRGKPVLTYYLEHGSVHAAIALLDAGATVSKQDIEFAFKSNRMSLLESIIKTMSKFPYIDANGNTALHLAAIYGRPKTAELLLKEGADLKAKNKKSQTPLHCAASKGMRKTVEVFINNKANVNAVDDEGDTPLHLAVAGGYFNTAELLVKKSAVMNTLNKRGNAPLHIAIQSGKNDIAIMLIKSEADVNIQDAEGKTPLHLTTIKNNPDMVRLLLEYFARADIKDKSGKMPIDYAQDDKIKDLLRKYGVCP